MKSKKISRGVVLLSLILTLVGNVSLAASTQSVNSKADVSKKPFVVVLKPVVQTEKHVGKEVISLRVVKELSPKLQANGVMNAKISSAKAAMKPSSTPHSIKQAHIVNSKTKISYKVLPDNSAVVLVGNKWVLRYSTPLNDLSPEKRAKILADRLKFYVAKKGDPSLIMPGMKNGVPVCRAKDNLLFTVDDKTAKDQKIQVSSLTLLWANNIRQALGARPIDRDFTRIASRSGISAAFSRREVFGIREMGIASWYGGMFQGKRAADGSKFNTNEFTAAHKSLPFGSIVKVTNLTNGKHCYVKISDRGPFVKGRVIDLSRAAAQKIGMSGISKVKLETLRSF